MAGTAPGLEKHKEGERIITSKKEVRRREYQKLAKELYSSKELTAAGVRSINIIASKEDWNAIVEQLLPSWKKQRLTELGLSYQDVQGMLDTTRGNMFLLGTVDKNTFLRNLHHEIGQGKYKRLPDVKKKYFHEEIAPKFTFDYIFDPVGQYPGDNDKYAILYEDYKILGKKGFMKKNKLRAEELKDMGME